MARITAMRAFAAAWACASPVAEERRLIALNESNQPAMMVSKIISESVTTSANPCERGNLVGLWVMGQGFYRRVIAGRLIQR